MYNRLWGMLCDPALFGGNWNNTLLCGGFYVNLNNTASNTNTNNGAAHLILKSLSYNAGHIAAQGAVTTPLGGNHLVASIR